MARPLRPEFDPPIEAESVPPRRSGVLPWLRLMRLPNVFTAIADVAMGYLFVHSVVESSSKLACLIAASAMLYTAGMVLNDVFDFAIDLKERPQRPLPAGQISRAAARTLGFSLLILGAACGWMAGFLPGAAAALPWRSGAIASALAIFIVAYNGWLKSTPIGPLAMGACRFFNVLLGMSTAQQLLGHVALGYSIPELLVAGGIGLYVVGITWFARSEATVSSKGPLVAAAVVMAVGVAVLASSAAFLQPLGIKANMYWALLAMLTAPVLWRCGVAISDPTPQNVQDAVKRSILTLIWLDAATVAAFAQPIDGIPLFAVAVAALLVPALLLGKWVYST